MPQTPDRPTTLATRKKPYRAPEVEVLGPMSEIVQGAGSTPNNADGPPNYSS